MSLVEVRALAVLAEHLSVPPWLSTDLVSVAAEASNLGTRGENSEVIASDFTLTSAFWAVLSLVDPFGLPSHQRSFAFFYDVLRHRIAEVHAVEPAEASTAAKALGRFLEIEYGRMTSRHSRSSWDAPTRSSLLETEGDRPRCWYCGYAFDPGVVAAFGNAETQVAHSLPAFVDYVTPRGCRPADLLVQVDHSLPLSRGGADSADNLRLSCGWCNRYKSALSLLTETSSYPDFYRHPRRGSVLRPMPFWAIRILGTKRKCRFVGCMNNQAVSQMVVGPASPAGALVPGNLAVFCVDHDPISDDRFVPRLRA